MAEPSIRPASYAQKRLWFLDQLDPGSSAYNLPRAIRIVGRFDREALQAALGAIVHRHESLRTTFEAFDGDPVQLVHPAGAHVEIPLINLQTVPGDQREEQAMAIASEEGQRRFDLSAGPLLRAKVVRLSHQEHILILTLHHIVTDGWSMSVLFGEIGEFYDAFSSGRAPKISELSIQYADFARWEQERVTADLLGREVEFWKRVLDGAPPLLDLPADRPRPRVQGYKGRRHSVMLDAALTERLGMLSTAARVTPFMTLLAAFQALLGRYTGVDAFVVGAPVAGRSEIELEQLIGFFVNTLPLRADLTGNPSFRGLLQRVRSSTLEAFAHQNVPFEKLVEELRPERSLSYTPLFQVMFVYQNMPRMPLKFSGTQIEEIEFDHGLSKFDLTLELCEQSDGMYCTWEYSSDLFDPERIERMAGHFEMLLRGIVKNPDCKLSELPVLTPAESKQILIEWNATERTYPREICIHDAFQDRAMQCGDTTAIFSEDRNITFAQLNDEANALATCLRKRGVELHGRVAVLVERSVDAVVTLLAVMKAGASYVPIDPAYPKQRIAFMLEDSGATVLVTQARLRTRLPHYDGAIVCLDRDRLEILSESQWNICGLARSEDPAYIIYTSGSTGTPKGVVASHRACMNRFAWMWRTYPFAAGEICAQRTGLSFVDSIWEIFGPLLQGVPLSIIPDASVKAPEEFVWRLAAHHVTRIVVVPSLLESLLEFYPDLQARVPDLRLCVSSAEPLSYGLYERFRSALPQVSLINLYGSSEVAADVTCFDTNTKPPNVVPIGRPIANVRIYVLDKNEKPVPIGVPGEIYIGGDCLALGYLNRPKLDAERFLTIRLGTATPERLYRTGDLGRYRQDGNIEFLGRTDRQIKIRGMRVEPGEIESALAAHPSIYQAVVVAKNTGGDFCLLAYVVPREKELIVVSELRRYLKARVAESLIPSAFITLESIPLLPNGKIDQNALPPVEAIRPDSQKQYVAPRNETEETLAKIWSEVLGVQGIGIYDNFFELGGHSLMAIRMIARIRRSFCVDVAIRSLFEEPTLAGLAVAVGNAQAIGTAPRWPILKRHPKTLDNREHLMARLKELSDEEVKGLLESALSERLPAAPAL